MTSPNDATITDYISRLETEPSRGNVVVIKVVNKRSIPLSFQIEPTGDLADPLHPNGEYVVVAQGHPSEYGTLVIDVEEDGVRVWVEGYDGQVFHNGVSVAY